VRQEAGQDLESVLTAVYLIVPKIV
jgi:hypothetical protein